MRMFARRAKGLLQFARCFQAGAPASGEAAGSVAAASQLEQWMQRSSFSTSMWDVGCDQARQELYMELNTARNLLPNRSNFFPEFTPHGVRLMPHRLPRHAMAAAAEEAEEDATEQGETEVLADSVRRKRKLKMKKHKYKKRMKKMRHQL